MENITRAATALWLAVTAVNFLVWAAVSAHQGSLDTPWWLWSGVGGGFVVAGVRLSRRAALA